MNLPESVRWLFGVSLAVYLAAMLGLGFWAKGRVRDATDFLVAGRRLPLSLAWMTLLATWFGAGTMLTAADAVSREGVRKAALDPLGAGLCLLLAGLLVARPLWQMGLLTVADFFRIRFGPVSEFLASCILVPSYFGWIAAQFVAMAEVLHLFFGLPVAWGILAVAVLGTAYTLLGGMWSVTVTDAVQISLVLIGLVVLAGSALSHLGGGGRGPGSWLDGWWALSDGVSAERWAIVPTESGDALLGWLAVLSIGALGNLPGQDLMQRIFAARSATVARRACWVAGTAYLGFGMLPVMLGIAAPFILGDGHSASVVPAMAATLLTPALALIFLMAVVSAVLSTIDSAILAPSGIFAQNIIPRLVRRPLPMLAVNRWCVAGVAASSLVMAYVGQGAYELLESSYEMILVGMFVPLMFGIYGKPRGGRPAVGCMLAGTGLWGWHQAWGWDEAFLAPWLSPWGWSVPTSLGCTAVGLLAYLGIDRLATDSRTPPLSRP